MGIIQGGMTRWYDYMAIIDINCKVYLTIPLYSPLQSHCSGNLPFRHNCKEIDQGNNPAISTVKIIV
jgi:hypothetical protein